MNAVIEKLPILILYPHNRCNCRCVMCDIWKIDTAAEISPRELERHAADIESLGVEWVVFSGGEPLMHSDLFRLCAILAARGIRITLLSSGLLLARHAQRIAGNVNDVIVSLDGPPAIHDSIRRVAGAFEQLAHGVAAIHSIKSSFPIAARTTVQRENCAVLQETVHTAKRLGLDSISFLAADLTSQAFHREEPWTVVRQTRVGVGAEQLDALRDEIEALIQSEDPFVLEGPEKLRRIVRHFEGNPVAPRCNAPWVSAVVETDGTVRPCFFHPAIGNLNGQTLRQVINGPQAVGFRENLDVATDPICRRCVCSLFRL